MISAGGHGFIDSHANKGSRRYRYYVEDKDDTSGPTIRLPARDIEDAVTGAVVGFLGDRPALLAGLGDMERAGVKHALERGTILSRQLAAASQRDRVITIRPLLRKVHYREDALRIELDARSVRAALGSPSPEVQDGDNYRSEDVENIVLHLPLTARRRGRQLKLLLNGEQRQSSIDEPLVTAISRAHVWAQSLIDGRVASITEIAQRESVALTYVSQLLPLGFLAPSIVEAILTGFQPASLTSDRLVRREKVALRWSKQVKTLVD